MTPIEWPNFNDPDEILFSIQGQASDRKLRLVCCACVRRVWYRLAQSPASRDAVALAEEFAEGRKTHQELAASLLKAERQIRVESRKKETHVVRAAAWCARKW